jgi:hypothetical protein
MIDNDQSPDQNQQQLTKIYSLDTFLTEQINDAIHQL